MLKTHALTDNETSARIISDHMRAAVFLIADGALPSNTDQGYVLRRLLRRAMMKTTRREVSQNDALKLVEIVVEKYGQVYPNLIEKKKLIEETITREFAQFKNTLDKGLKQFEKAAGSNITGEEAFILFTTHGFPIELTEELALDRNLTVDRMGFDEAMEKHQTLSRTGAQGKFKGGLADNSEKTTMLHTATHLMLAAMRKFVGEHIHQAGSNITEERSRFDFTHDAKLDEEQVKNIENYVNEAISKKCDVVIEQIPKEKAKEQGVEGSFWEKYPDIVNVYRIKCDDGTIYSQELCGGPHVKNTGDIEGEFRIKKQEASSAGVRRIKAVLE